MDALTELESRVDFLLTRLKTLERENSRLRLDLETAMRERAALAAENESMKEQVRRNEELRCAVLERVRKLLRQVRRHEASGFGA